MENENETKLNACVCIQTRLIITRLFGKFTQLPEEWVPNKRALH